MGRSLGQGLENPPLWLLAVPFGKDLQGYSKKAGTLLKTSLLPVRGVVDCTEIGMLMQDIL